MRDRLGAFVAHVDITIAGNAAGPLAGLTFAAKDLFDVRGTVTGCGNPDWERTHAPATGSAWAVERLLDAGATLIGKTVTDEISLGLLGINRFFGTPINPRARDLVPGGSSSGSAAAVAGGLADLALGTDSGGSVRIPASFTGLYGLRPSHGAIPVDGMMTQAPSFDTAGFFARDAATMTQIGDALLPAATITPPHELLIATDCFAAADAVVRDALQGAVARVAGVFAATRDVVLAAEGLAHWAAQQRLLQCHEFGRTFADWIDATNPRFSFEVAGLADQRGDDRRGRPARPAHLPRQGPGRAGCHARRRARAVPADIGHPADPPRRAAERDAARGRSHLPPHLHRRPGRAAAGEPAAGQP